MKKLLAVVIGLVIVTGGIYIYLENREKNLSHATPEEAVLNTEDPSLEVQRIVDTRVYDRTAYVFFYSQINDVEEDYLSVARVYEEEYGWRLADAIGVGNTNQQQAGSASGGEDYIVAYADPETARVTYGPYEAEKIELDDNLIKVFFLHDVEDGLQSDYQFSYFDEEGKEILN